MSWISTLLLGGPLDRDVLQSAERSTLMLIDDPRRQYSSFALRLLAATVVATAGIAADSATTIIGAMLIAPLMSPMLGTALATALGRPLAAVRALAITLAGMALVVVVSAGGDGRHPGRGRHGDELAGARPHLASPGGPHHRARVRFHGGACGAA